MDDADESEPAWFSQEGAHSGSEPADGKTARRCRRELAADASAPELAALIGAGRRTEASLPEDADSEGRGPFAAGCLRQLEDSDDRPSCRQRFILNARNRRMMMQPLGPTMAK